MRGPPDSGGHHAVSRHLDPGAHLGLVPRPAPLTADAVLESPIGTCGRRTRAIRNMLRTGFLQSPTFASLLARLERERS